MADASAPTPHDDASEPTPHDDDLDGHTLESDLADILELGVEEFAKLKGLDKGFGVGGFVDSPAEGLRHEEDVDLFDEDGDGHADDDDRSGIHGLTVSEYKALLSSLSLSDDGIWSFPKSQNHARQQVPLTRCQSARLSVLADLIASGATA